MEATRVLLGPRGWRPAPGAFRVRLSENDVAGSREGDAQEWASPGAAEAPAPVQGPAPWCQRCRASVLTQAGPRWARVDAVEVSLSAAVTSELCVQDVLEAVCAFVYGPDYDSEALVRAGLYRERDGVMHLLPLDVRFADCIRAFSIGSALVFREHGFARFAEPYMQARPDAVRAELQFREALFRLQQGHFRAASVVHAGELLAMAYMGTTADPELVAPCEAAGPLCAFAADIKPEALCGRVGLPAVLSQALGSYRELLQMEESLDARKAGFVRAAKRLFEPLWNADFFQAQRLHSSCPRTCGPSSPHRSRSRRPARTGSLQSTGAESAYSATSAPHVAAVTSNFVYGAPRAPHVDSLASPACVEWFALNLTGVHICTAQGEVIAFPLQAVQSWTSSADGSVLAIALTEGRVVHLAGIADRAAETAATLLGLYADAHSSGYMSADSIRLIFCKLRGAPLSTTCRSDVRVIWPVNRRAGHTELHAKAQSPPSAAKSSPSDETAASSPRAATAAMAEPENSQLPKGPNGPALPSDAVRAKPADEIESSPAATEMDEGVPVETATHDNIESHMPQIRHLEAVIGKLRSSVLKSLLRKLRRQVLARRFREWKSAARRVPEASLAQRDAKRARSTVRILLLRSKLAQDRLTAAWHAWKTYTRDSRERDNKDDGPSQEGSQLRTAMQTWKVAAWRSKVEWRKLVIAWDQWVSFARVRMQLGKLSQGWYACRLRFAFEAWKTEAHAKSAANSLEEVLSKALVRVRLQRGMNRWKQYIIRQLMVQGAALDGLTRFVSQYMLRQAWDRFRFAYAASNASIFCRLVHGAIRRQRLAHCLGRWKRFIMVREAEESYAIGVITEVFSRYVAAAESASVAAHFAWWRRWTGMVSLQHAIASGLRRSGLRRGIDAWKRFVMARTVETSYGASLITEALSACLSRTRTQALTRSFRLWRNWARAEHLESAISQAVDRLYKRRGLEAWKRFDMLRTMELTWALDRMAFFYLHHAGQDRLQRAFCRWRAWSLLQQGDSVQRQVDIEVKHGESAAPAREGQLWDMRLRLAKCQQSISQLEVECHRDLRFARQALRAGHGSEIM